MPTALIVDDEPEANSLMAMLVQLRGYRTVSALNARDALDALEHEEFDVVFLDLMLPDLNGFEVCRQIKSRPSTALTTVVIVTARVASENRTASFLHNADQFVPKPYTPDQIFEALDLADELRLVHSSDRRTGSIPFEVDEERETLRRLGQLSSLLIARTPLPPERVALLISILHGFFAQAEAWGLANRVGTIATLDYQALEDRLVLTLRDHQGWLASWEDSPDQTREVLTEIAAREFDEFEFQNDENRVHFVRLFNDEPR
ncbi:MAG: response regulator [Isosphaeraceae bacterium]